MKKLLAVAVLATSTAFAADSRMIYDVQYLPNAGTTYGESEWAYQKRTIELKGSSAEVEVKAWALEQTVGHSFTDRLSVQGSINYTKGDVEYSNIPGTDDVEAKGISDPTITARYRVMDEAWRLDIIGGALISLGDSEIKSNGDSNNLQGGSDLFLGAQIGQRSDNMQWAVLGQYNHNLKATSEDKSSGTKETTKDDAYGDWTLRADILNKLAEKSFLRTHLTGMWAPRYDSKTEGQESTSASTAMWELGTQYQHLMSNDLLAYGGVDYRRNSSDTGYTDSDTAWVLTLGARYQF